MVKLFLLLLNSVIKTFYFNSFIHFYVAIMQLNDCTLNNIFYFH